MARVEVNIGPVGSILRQTQSTCIVKTSGGNIYCIFVTQIDNALYWVKSTDGGFTWTDPVLVKSLGGVQSGFCIWPDQWTPGDSGTKVHIWYFDHSNDDVSYRALDTNNDTLGAEITVFTGTTTLAGANSCISGTKARGGNLYCGFDVDGGTETGFYRSVDNGANWTSRSNLNEGTSDYYSIVPGFAADNQDVMAIFWDRSADELSRKIYDDSANTWAETSIATSMVDLSSATGAPNFSAVCDAANSKVIMAAWSAADTANADLRFWSITESAITEGTNIVLNSTDDQGFVALGLATDTNIIYAFYGGKSDGSETFPTAINIYYKTSTDGGSTWGSETKITNSTRGFDYLGTFRQFTGDFGVCYRSETAAIDTLMFNTLLPQARARMAIGVS